MQTARLGTTTVAPERDDGLAAPTTATRRGMAAWVSSSPGVRALVAAGLVGAVALWWFAVPPGFTATPGNLATSLGELFGIAAGYLVCVQLLLIARLPWPTEAIGFDRLVAWHRVLGTSVMLLVASHLVFLVGGVMLSGAPLPWDAFFTLIGEYPDMSSALAGGAILVGVAVSAARWLRARLSYEAWYWLHVTAYVGVFLSFSHQLNAGAHFVADPFNRVVWLVLYLSTASAIITWRALLPLQKAWRHRMRVAAVSAAGEGSCNVWLEGLRLDDLGIRPGQFLLFRFMARGHLLSAHPYSISQVPRNGRLRITVAASGDHSRRMRTLKPGTPVFVEGPFGRLTADLSGARRVLLVAGGAGIGPIAALAREFSLRGRRVVLAYRARSASHLALSDELCRIPGVTLLPLVGRRRELGYDPLSARHLVDLIPDVSRYEAFVCGPPGMTATACTELHRAGMPRRKIHYEEMSLA